MKKIFSILSLLCATFFVASCTNDMEGVEEGQVGYLKLELNTLVSTHTRAVTNKPADYDARKLQVTLTSEDGTVTKTSVWTAEAGFVNEEFKGNIMLKPGKYTIEAHSYGWDGSGSGFDAPFYAGTQEVTVKQGTLSRATVTCTQDNVKVSVVWDQSFQSYFTEAYTVVSSSISDVSALTFTMGSTAKSAYFPVGDLNLLLSVTNKSNQFYSLRSTFTDVHARDHFIFTYKVADAGTHGSVEVLVDEATQTYNFTIPVNRKPGVSLDAKKADAWATFANLAVEVTADNYDHTKLNLEWKKLGADAWTTIEGSALTRDKDVFSYKLTGLEPATTYTYRAVYNDGENDATSAEVNFTTEAVTALYNAGFENWYSEGRIDYCGSAADGKYWNSSNGGAATYIGSVTTQDTGFKHGGNSSARLGTQWAVVKLAAASLFTGDFIGLIGTKGAKLDWGVPFTSRPTALKGYYSYAPGAVNRGTQPSGVGAPAKDENDECQIFCALVTEQFHVANAEASGYEMTTSLDWENDPRVVAYGQMTQNSSSNGAWQELNIPLKYHSLTTKPTYMIIVCSASKWGDYFYGSDSSVLHIDDFELVYGDEPSVK